MDIKEKREIEKIIKDYINARGVSVLPEATAIKLGVVTLRGDLGGSGSSPQVRGFTDSNGVSLPIGAITDNQFLKRSGSSLISSSGGGGVSLEDVYPVGSIYISVVATNPGTVFGMGTWVAFGTGRVLVGIDAGDPNFDVVEETGGAKTVASSAQTFAGAALASHQHDAITAGTPAGSNVAEATHTHAYAQIVNHVHVQKLPSGQTGSQASGTRDTSTTGSVNDALSTNNPTGGVASGTTDAGSSHNHVFNGTQMATHQHAGVSAGTPAGTNTPGAASSVVQPYLVVYMWKRTA